MLRLIKAKLIMANLFELKTGRVKYSIFFKRSTFLYVQAIHILYLYIIFLESNVQIPVLSSILSFSLYLCLLYGCVCDSPNRITPMNVYLLAALLRIGIGSAFFSYVQSIGLSGYLSLGPRDTSRSIANGYFLVMLGDWFFIAGYYMKWRPSKSIPLYLRTFSSSQLDSIKLAIFFTLLISISIKFMFAVGLPIHKLGAVANRLNTWGLPSVVFIMLAYRGYTQGRIKFYLTISILIITAYNLYLGFNSYMKSDIFVPILPFIVYGLGFSRKINLAGKVRWQKGKIAAYSSIGMLCLLVIFSYSQDRRGEFDRDNKGQIVGDSPDIIPFLFESITKTFTGEFLSEKNLKDEKGVFSIISRANTIVPSAWAYQYVQDFGTMEMETIYDGFIAIIPRILWPEKPLIATGRKVAVLLGQAENVETATTSTGIPIAASFYWNGGYFTLIIGMFVAGILYSIAWNWFSPQILYNPFACIACFYLYSESYRGFESATDGGIAYFAYLGLVFFPLSQFYHRYRKGSILKSYL